MLDLCLQYVNPQFMIPLDVNKQKLFVKFLITRAVLNHQYKNNKDILGRKQQKLMSTDHFLLNFLKIVKRTTAGNIETRVTVVSSCKVHRA